MPYQIHYLLNVSVTQCKRDIAKAQDLCLLYWAINIW